MRTIAFNHRRFLAGTIAAGALVALAFGSIASAPAASAMPDMGAAKTATTPKALALRTAMRSLWQAHGTWTERAIVDYVGELPDTKLVVQRLLQNQTEIGNAVKPYYGSKAGTELTKLLQEHIVDAVAVLAAAKSGDAAAIAKAKSAFYANGDQVAGFLHSANPDHWSLPEMRTMMRVHLNQVVGLAVAQLTGRYGAAIRLYGAYIDHLLQMADMLSEGIVQQFPARFR
ncbi:MAG: hypothetical protein JST31_14695 [Actinobacteria bacterium]|nr:hypothetical protein [Actinomycetota bacterium]